jgi:hypothetical protein
MSRTLATLCRPDQQLFFRDLALRDFCSGKNFTPVTNSINDISPGQATNPSIFLEMRIRKESKGIGKREVITSYPDHLAIKR